jgi:hypothetical protein
MDLPGAADNLKQFRARLRGEVQVVPAAAERGEGIEEVKRVVAERVTATE